ncbi:MAG: hypothetical protein NTW86_28545 [Candidatus Sumerlaeota bacterium]|nr:hypothetical protein [Candidatus Sumerlaeota bacterium]
MGWYQTFMNLPGVIHVIGQLALFVAGAAIGLLGGKWWGWLIAAAAVGWAWLKWMPYFM